VLRNPSDRPVGRDVELQTVLGAVTGLRSGTGATLFIEGEAGIGKSRLVAEAAGEARSAGVHVLKGAAHLFESTRPFGALVDALGLRPRSPDPRRAALGELIGAGARPRSDSTIVDARHRIIEDLIELIEVECTQRPVALIVEDLHWADSSTLIAVRAMIHRLADSPFLFVGSSRPTPRPVELDQLLDDANAVGAIIVQLRPLTPEAVTEIVANELGAPPGPRLRQVVESAGGNPLWVIELIRSLQTEQHLERSDEGVETHATELPGSLRELVIRRLRFLSEPTLELLQFAAMLGDAVSIPDLAIVSQRPPKDVIALLTDAFRAGLLDGSNDGVVFRHQLVHDAIYQHVPLPARRILHREAATALADAGADTLQVADQLVRGARRGDLDAVRRLRDASRDVAASSPSMSVELLLRAESLLPAGHVDADLVATELVEASLRAGNVAGAAARAEAVLDRRHRPDVDTALRLLLLSALSVQNRPVDLIRHTESTLTTVKDLSLADQSLVLAQASYGRTLSGDMVGGEASARRALELAEQAGDDSMVVWSLAAMSVPVSRQGRYGEAVELGRRAVRHMEHSGDMAARLRHPHFFLGMALCDADRIDQALQAYDRAIAEYHELGSGWLLPDTVLLSAAARFLTGDWDDALAGLQAGLRTADDQGQRILVAHSHGYESLIHLGRGDHDAAARAIAPFERELTSDSPCFYAETVAVAAALLAETTGDDRRALDLLRRFWMLDRNRQIHYYDRSIAPNLVRLALRLGLDDLAQDVTTLAEQGAARCPDVPSVRAAALRCRGHLEQSTDLMMHAVEESRAGERVLDHAAACEDAAALIARRNGRDGAVSFLVEALDIYDRAGAGAWAARVLASLRQLGVQRGARGPRQRPAHGWGSLTTTEHSVSLLVAEGLTNREVARRLHMSPHTVNTHLRHIFDKLSVANRAALSAAVSRHAHGTSRRLT
jgi:DNA-binding CsgD family transcriptional regulator/tetratricopeptide (TPR) repeat protein